MDPRPDQELIAYIKRRQEAGSNLVEITNELESAGWEQGDIGKAMESLRATVQEKVVDPAQPEPEPVITEKKIIIPTRIGSLIILLAAVISGSTCFWYAFSYEAPDSVSAQTQVRRGVTESATTTATTTTTTTSTKEL